MFRLYSIAVLFAITEGLSAQSIKSVHTVFVDSGWANNSVNTVIFRKNSLCTYKNTQYISYYNKEGVVVLGKRTIGKTKWFLKTTDYKGDVADAHRSISIITDGDGYLHMSWNHHGNKLHYSKSMAPGALQMTEELCMTGIAESNVTYPEFHCCQVVIFYFFTEMEDLGRETW